MNRKQFVVVREGQNGGPVSVFDTLDEAQDEARLVAASTKRPVMVVKAVFVAAPKFDLAEQTLA